MDCSVAAVHQNSNVKPAEARSTSAPSLPPMPKPTSSKRSHSARMRAASPKRSSTPTPCQLGVALAARKSRHSQALHPFRKIGLPVKGAGFGEQESGRTQRHSGDRDEVDARRFGGALNLERRECVERRRRIGDRRPLHLETSSARDQDMRDDRGRKLRTFGTPQSSWLPERLFPVK
jgi:hypothetical protein